MASLIFLACGITRAAEAPTRRPNIVLVMADDVGYGDLACLGNPIVRTPNIDRFHGESVRFTNFHGSPTSSATRAALLTGRHEFHSGVTHTMLERERMRLGVVTLAQVLQAAGYATGLFGKWHLGDADAYQPQKRGFEETLIHGGGGFGDAKFGSGGDVPENTYFDPTLLENGTFIKTIGYGTDIFFSRAIEWMDEKIDTGRPYFACIMPSAGREPLDCPPQFERPYAGQVPPKVAAFYGMITNLDTNFGRLLEKLDEWGYEGDTLVILMSDNGSAMGVDIFNAGRRGGKGSPYEGGTRVPSFWRWPKGWQGGVDVPALTSQLDVFPTLARIAGATVPSDVAGKLEGRDLGPLLKNPAAEWANRTLYSHTGGWERGAAAQSKFINCSVRDNRFSLVNDNELYDLTADPGQSKDILAQNPDAAARLRAAYEKWWTEIQGDLVNEDAVGPAIGAFKERYQRQFESDRANKESAPSN